jgi:hypothetical protein
MSKLQRTTYHEAGHAVASYVLKRRFSKITIIPGGDHLGSTSKLDSSLYDVSDRDSNSRNRIEADIIVHFAGQIAEKLFTSGYNWEVARGEDGTAVCLVESLVSSVDEREAYLNWLFIRAKELIKLPCHWRAVEELAFELLKERSIGYRKARRIIADAMGSNDQV